LEQDIAGFGQGSANYLGWNRILLGSGRDLLSTWVGTGYCWVRAGIC